MRGRNDEQNYKMQYLWRVFSVKEVKDHKDKNHRITNSMSVVKKVPIDDDRV